MPNKNASNAPINAVKSAMQKIKRRMPKVDANKNAAKVRGGRLGDSSGYGLIKDSKKESKRDFLKKELKTIS